MSRYRKIDTRIWNDEKFRDLSDAGQLAFLFVLTHPSMTALGAMRATIPGLAAEKGWTTEAFGKAFGEALAKGMVEHEEKASCVALPNFLRYNPPENPNVVKAWASSLDLIPEGGLKTLTMQRAKAFLKGKTKAFAEALPKAFAEAFAEGAPKGMPKQEQEQEQEQEPKKVRRDDEGYTLRSHAREASVSEYAIDPPATADEGRRYLEGRGVPAHEIDGKLHKLMAFRLYPSDLEHYRRAA